MTCIFCKIVAGEIPCEKLDETENFLAFLDIAPINEGHALVIPKQHFSDWSEFPDELASEWVKFTKNTMALVKKGVGADGVNVGNNNGVAAGQVVFHQHTHIIPRFSDDGLESWPGDQVSSEQLAEVKKKILDN